MDKILITGGAGYIGSHTAKYLLKNGYNVLILDNLSNGYIDSIEVLKKYSNKLEFIEADLSDKDYLDEIFKNNKIDTIMHFAAKVSIPESIEKPDLYWQENYLNSVNLVESAKEANINKFIFSSSCVVYGTPKYIPIDENHPTNPESPYGKTKLDFEKYLQNVDNLKYIIFRYFNVGGSDEKGDLGKANVESEDVINNLIKVGLGQESTFHLFGDNYKTKDGTAIRDFIHVEDIAQAHTLALENIDSKNNNIFNLGSETGFTIREIIEKASEIIGKKIPVQIEARRLGDIPISVAGAKKVKEELNWNPKFSSLDNIIKTDWNWRKNNPFGYLGREDG